MARSSDNSSEEREPKDSDVLAAERTEKAEERTDQPEERTEKAEERTDQAEERTKWSEQRTGWSEERTDWSEERTDWAEERTKWAEERTKWADQRVFLAQERTYSAWIRTATASMAVGFAIIRFMDEVEPQWLTRATGLFFILIGGFIVTLAFFHFRRVTLHMSKSKTPEMGVSTKWVGLISGVLFLCAIAGAVLVFGGS